MKTSNKMKGAAHKHRVDREGVGQYEQALNIRETKRGTLRELSLFSRELLPNIYAVRKKGKVLSCFCLSVHRLGPSIRMQWETRV